MSCIQIIGLVLDIVGAAFMFCGTEELNKGIINLLNKLNEESIKNKPKKERGENQLNTTDFNFLLRSTELFVKKKLSNRYTKIGVVLLLIGFIFQLIACF